jgi:hypothetical protein
LGKTRRDILQHKDIVDGDDINVVDPLFFEPLIGVYVARDLSTACPGERARYANLQGVRLILLPRSRTMSYKDVSAPELGDVEGLLRAVFLDRCVSGELVARLDLPVGHGGNVVRN